MKYFGRLQDCNRSPSGSRQAMPRAAPLRWRCGAALRHLLFPSGPQPTCRRLGASLVAGRPTPAVPNGDACASMAASPRAAPLTLRATSISFLTTIRKLGKGADAVSEGPSATGRTSSRSRCPAPGPPAPANRASPGKVNIFGQSGRWEKKRGEKRSGLAALALKELRKLDFYI